jgi:hypothetical protein
VFHCTFLLPFSLLSYSLLHWNISLSHTSESLKPFRFFIIYNNCCHIFHKYLWILIEYYETVVPEAATSLIPLIANIFSIFIKIYFVFDRSYFQEGLFVQMWIRSVTEEPNMGGVLPSSTEDGKISSFWKVFSSF